MERFSCFSKFFEAGHKISVLDQVATLWVGLRKTYSQGYGIWWEISASLTNQMPIQECQRSLLQLRQSFLVAQAQLARPKDQVGMESRQQIQHLMILRTFGTCPDLDVQVPLNRLAGQDACSAINCPRAPLWILFAAARKGRCLAHAMFGSWNLEASTVHICAPLQALRSSCRAPRATVCPAEVG